MDFYSDIHVYNGDVCVPPDKVRIEDFDTRDKGFISLKHTMPLSGGTAVTDFYNKVNNGMSYYVQDTTGSLSLFLDAFVDVGRYFNSDVNNKFIYFTNNGSTNTAKNYIYKTAQAGCAFELIVRDRSGAVNPSNAVTCRREQILSITDDSKLWHTYKRNIVYKYKDEKWSWTFDSWHEIHEAEYKPMYENASATSSEKYVYIPYAICTTYDIDAGTDKLINPLFKTANIQATNKITAQTFNAISDRRQKTNIQPIRLNNILDLPIYSFDYINGEKNQIGCMAQDLQKICPQIVKEGNDGYLTIQENKIVYLLLQQIQLLAKEVEDLKRHGK